MAIPIGVEGRIISPQVKEPYIFVRDNQTTSGGYILLMCKEPIFGPKSDPNLWVYDEWIEPQELDGYFQYTGWVVEWLEEGQSFSSSD